MVSYIQHLAKVICSLPQGPWSYPNRYGQNSLTLTTAIHQHMLNVFIFLTCALYWFNHADNCKTTSWVKPLVAYQLPQLVTPSVKLWSGIPVDLLFMHSAHGLVNSPILRLFTHWGRVTHICVSKINIIGSDNGLSPGRRRAIIWTDDGILLISSLGNGDHFVSASMC